MLFKGEEKKFLTTLEIEIKKKQVNLYYQSYKIIKPNYLRSIKRVI